MDATLALVRDVEVLPIDVGHWVRRDAPDAFTNGTREFLERNRPRP